MLRNRTWTPPFAAGAASKEQQAHPPTRPRRESNPSARCSPPHRHIRLEPALRHRPTRTEATAVALITSMAATVIPDNAGARSGCFLRQPTGFEESGVALRTQGVETFFSHSSLSREQRRSAGPLLLSREVVVGPAVEPTLATGTPVSVTPGTGTFAAPLSPLQGNTTYYVRAFATTSAGTTYGSQVVFSIAESIPVVVTGAAVAGASLDTFTVSGEVTNDGGTPVTSRGIVYGLTGTPTLGAAMDAPANGAGAGAFSRSSS
jgi:hypothetical protein